MDGTTTTISVTGRTTVAHTLSSLTAGKSYSFTIAAVAGSAESVQSSQMTAVPTPSGLPGLTAFGGERKIELSWAASNEAGVTGYKIRQVVDGTLTEININSRLTLRHTITAVTVGKNYIFTIAVVAGSAESAQSVPTNPVTPTASAVRPTSAPSGFMARAGIAKVTLLWNRVNGATSYKIYRDGTALNTSSNTSYEAGGLNAGVEYSFTVSAVNSGGEGPQSSAAKATPTVPAVTGLSAVGNAGQVVLRWTASGNAGVTDYKIRQTVDGVTTEIDVSGRTTATYTVTSLTDGKEYSFTIAAVAGSLESVPSSAVKATPTSNPQDVRAVVSEVAAGTAGSRQRVVLSWSAVTSAVSYKVYQDGTALAATITVPTHTVNNLIDGKSYTFTVSSVDGSNQESAQSTAVATCNFTDADGDGLIEICTLDHLKRIDTDSTTRRGRYELVRDLDFQQSVQLCTEFCQLDQQDMETSKWKYSVLIIDYRSTCCWTKSGLGQ